MTNLSIELLRSFVAVVEKGSILKATERIFLTQSALSLQIKRLEDIVQCPLFKRDGKRRMVITPAGRELLIYAHEILAINDRAIAAFTDKAGTEPVRLGVVQDMAEQLLPQVLARLSAEHPDTQLDIRVAGSSQLVSGLRDGRLDLAVSVSRQADAAPVSVHWIGKRALAEQGVLPVVLLPEPCVFHAIALNSLEAAGQRYRIVVETPSLAGLKAAVSAGLGVTCRTLAFLPKDEAEELVLFGLPPLPNVYYLLHEQAQKTPATKRLAGLLREALSALS